MEVTKDNDIKRWEEYILYPSSKVPTFVLS